MNIEWSSATRKMLHTAQSTHNQANANNNNK